MEKKNNKYKPGNGDEITEEMLKARKKSAKKHVLMQDADREIEELKSEIELLREELMRYKKLEEDYLDRIKRLHADYDNFRKRALREQGQTVQRANKDLIEKLLPVIDSFEQAIAMGEDLMGGQDDFLKGVIMIHGKLMETLEKEGVEVINPHGKEFNPHECEVAVTAEDDEAEEGTVLDVLRKGYKINDFLVRPAVVKVCKKS
ncbi:MAG: nucleotide exchange factor GrpE [Actinobacteria bacterium]|nr:nucleotide exchange factor GrpE [Actinomycetota bacterium]